LCYCGAVKIILCVYNTPLDIDPYYYWISRNRQLVIVITIVLGNRMAANQTTDCDIDNCPGVAEDPSLVCIVCGASVHPTCFKSAVRKLS
jgi:hypothetical protein